MNMKVSKSTHEALVGDRVKCLLHVKEYTHSTTSFVNYILPVCMVQACILLKPPSELITFCFVHTIICDDQKNGSNNGDTV